MPLRDREPAGLEHAGDPPDGRLGGRGVERLERQREPAARLVFVRRGPFGLRLRSSETTVDPVSAFVGRPGDEQSYTAVVTPPR